MRQVIFDIKPSTRLRYHGHKCTVRRVYNGYAYLEFEMVLYKKCGEDAWYRIKALQQDKNVLLGW